MTQGINQLNIVLIGHTIRLDLVLVPRHGRRESVLRQLQLLLPLIWLRRLYPTLLARAWGCCIEELGALVSRFYETSMSWGR